MNSYMKPINIAKLLTVFNFEIEAVLDNLKCAKCKYMLVDAHQLLCGCRFCRVCIDDVIASGVQFCPGSSEECVGSPLSSVVPEFNAVKSISKLTAKCLQPSCLCECPLADIEGHLRICQRKIVDCPFRKFGCQKNELTAEDIVDHLQQESSSHSEILITTVSNINEHVEILKGELTLKNEQISTIMEELKHVKNENKSIKNENEAIKNKNESIKQEKEDLSYRLTQLAKTIEEIKSKQSAMQTATELEKLSTDDDIQSIMGDIKSMKSHLKLIKTAVGLGQVNTKCDWWVTNVDVNKTHWNWGFARTSNCFVGKVRSYTYQLGSGNNIRTGKFRIELRIIGGPCDSILKWPFWGAVTIIVADICRYESCVVMTKQCLIDRPMNNQYTSSDRFVFLHANLKAAGINLGCGVRVSCQIYPVVSSDTNSQQ